MKTWINKKNIGGILAVSALLLIFFSKTIYTFRLPEVTAVKPQTGKLSKVETGYGTAEWAETLSVYVPEKGIVDEIYVNEGEYVEAGENLFSMKYDRDENDRRLKESENTVKRLQGELLEIEGRIALSKQPDAEHLKTKQSLARAEKHLSAAGSLVDAGAISVQDFNDAKDEAEYLRLKLKNLNWEKAETDHAMQLELEAKKLELEKQAISGEAYKETRRIHDTETVVKAPADGMLVLSSVKKGEMVMKDTLALTVGTGSEYVLECPVSLENNFITTGDTCKLSNPATQTTGIVSSVVPAESGKTVKIRFSAENVTEGETFEVLFEKESRTSYVLVPNAAVCKDKDGYFLKQVKRRDGIMGKEYYLDRTDIYIGDSDARNTAVVQGITFFEPVVLYSEKTAVTGDVVLLENAGEFFEK